MSKIIGITDIHGEYDKLCAVIDQLDINKEDTIIFMGDYIDRGPKSKEVIEKVLELQNYCNCVYLIGSHEYAMLHAKQNEYYDYLF